MDPDAVAPSWPEGPAPELGCHAVMIWIAGGTFRMESEMTSVGAIPCPGRGLGGGGHRGNLRYDHSVWCGPRCHANLGACVSVDEGQCGTKDRFARFVPQQSVRPSWTRRCCHCQAVGRSMPSWAAICCTGPRLARARITCARCTRDRWRSAQVRDTCKGAPRRRREQSRPRPCSSRFPCAPPNRTRVTRIRAL